MSRRSSNFEFSIRGDELEQNRIQLENNLQRTDLSLNLSSTPDDYSDVEYPRHNPGPSPFPAFASFEQPSRDHFDPDEQSNYQAWSYHTADDEEGVNPYGGETLSTAAHHASALTLSAGLGGRVSRRDVSLSGAEYDPDRPLNSIMAGINSRFSVFGADSTKSRMNSQPVDFDPLIVDDTAELDRVLASGTRLMSATGLRSPISSGSSSPSDSPASPSLSRPKLSDALHRVAFSPKRPRSAQSGFLPRYNSDGLASPSPVRNQLERDPPTPRQQQHYSVSYGGPGMQSLSYAPAEPDVRVQPPTPDSEGNSSKFTRLARGLAQEIGEMERNKRDDAQSTTRESRTNRRYPLKDVVNQMTAETTPRRTPGRGKVHLPDVTGLTSAVGSPSKIRMEYAEYEGRDDRDGEARLLATMNVVQSKLAHLESENSVSRRRVRELELELEACKKEVARERTRVLEREQVITEQQAVATEYDRRPTTSRQEKGKARAQMRNVSVSVDLGSETRYKEAVEEKKALEALIGTLRTHLARLTSELSDHQRLLTELRTLRDSDSRALREKGQDVDRLRQEVERLAGEVEVLRGVVEEGLKERREIREQLSQEHSHLNGSEKSAEMNLEPEQPVPQDSDDDDDEMSMTSGNRSPTPSPHHTGLVDRTMRTDRATMGTLSSQAAGGVSSQPFISTDEIDRISAEVSERRSERERSTLSQSRRSVSSSHSRLLSPAPSAPPSRAGSRNAFRRNEDTQEEDDHRDDSSVADFARGIVQDRRPSSPATPPRSSQTQSRPAAPTPAHALAREPAPTTTVPPKPQPSRQNQAAVSETPFPSIRGARLERMFFSAPEHNTQTCTVCHRRRRAHRSDRTAGIDDRQPHFWTARACRPEEHDDEGFVEGQENYARDPHLRRAGKAMQSGANPEDGDRVPPQTVLTRVLRELEDDFTHYKSIYVELADQYKIIDAVSNVVKRNVLAEHLREVIDILEQKGDQIASLYDLLNFKDKPAAESVVPEHNGRSQSQPAPVGPSGTWGRSRTKKHPIFA